MIFAWRDDFIATMRGPDFLKLYAVFAILVLIGVWAAIRLTDRSRRMPTPDIPEKPDPYQFAYLRGGINEVIRLAVFNLIHRGYFVTGGTKERGVPTKVAQAHIPPSTTELGKVEKVLYDMAVSSVDPKSFFSGKQRDLVEGYTDHYRNRLLEDKLLFDSTHRCTSIFIALAGFVLLAGLAFYKAHAAVTSGHRNIAFLVIMSFVSIAILFVIARRRRISDRGNRYVEEMRSAFGELKSRLKAQDDPEVASTTLLTVGLFGLPVLAATGFDDVHMMFKRGGGTDFSVAGCGSCGGSFELGCGAGSGCGASGGCGGGGCGGGCGGCGGG